MTAIAFDKVSYDLPLLNKKALKNVSFTVEKGEYITLCGRNGSGKSTLAKICALLLEPSEGTVFIDGQNIIQKKTIPVGMVFQNPDNQIICPTCEEDVAFGPENLDLTSLEIRERVDAALQKTGLFEYAKLPPENLSGGQKQRLAIAGVLALKSNIIIFDEPTSMLDPKGREMTLSAMDELHNEGVTILHITHSMEEVMRSQKVFVLQNGELVFTGSPKELFDSFSYAEDLGLSAPLPVRMRHALEKENIILSAKPLTIEEFVGSVCV